jgi:hypothetical protein
MEEIKIDENLPIINKIKHPTKQKGKKKVQNVRTLKSWEMGPKKKGYKMEGPKS